MAPYDGSQASWVTIPDSSGTASPTESMLSFSDEIKVGTDINNDDDNNDERGEESENEDGDHDGLTAVDSRKFTVGKVEPAATVITICELIRVGDFVMLHDRACQVMSIERFNSGKYKFVGRDVLSENFYEGFSIEYEPYTGQIFQTMRVPIFKKYRVSSLEQDHHIVAETDHLKKLRIPMVPTTELWEYLESEFSTSQGSVKVLVVSFQNQEYGFGISAVDELASADLHSLAFNGKIPEIDAVVKQLPLSQVMATVNKLDSNDTPALFYAIREGHLKTAGYLIGVGARLDIINNIQETALSIAVSQAQDNEVMYSFAEHLLITGASPITSIDPAVAALLSASAKGELNVVRDLVEKQKPRVHVDGTDLLGYTALHEAARYGRKEVAEYLIEKNATIDKVVQLGGDGVLHMVIRGGRHRNYLDPGRRNVTETFGKGHVEVMELLLRRCPASRFRERRYDGKTVQDVVLDQLRWGKMTSAEMTTLQQILMVLKSFSSRRSEATTGQEDNQALSVQAKHQPVRIQHYTKNTVGEVKVLGVASLQDDTPKKNGWRWIHIPENNKAMVKEVTSTLSENQIKDRDARRAYSDGVHTFIDDTFNEIQAPSHHPGMRRPVFSPLHRSYSEMFSLVIPYFQAKPLNPQRESENENSMQSESNSTDDGKLHNVNTKMEPREKMSHEPCPLDQSYYIFLKKSECDRRKYDQVIRKHLSRTGKQNSAQLKVLMVSQLWVWKIDSNTILTALSSHDLNCRGCSEDEHDNNLLRCISDALAKDLPHSIDAMVKRMLLCAVDFVDAPTNSGFNESILDMFDQSIAFHKQDEVMCYKTFFDAQRNDEDSNRIQETEDEKEQSSRKEEDEMCKMYKEMDTLREIKDVQDELRMIGRVFYDQKMVVKTTLRALMGNAKRSGRPEKDYVWKSLEIHRQRVKRTQRLLDDANSVGESVRELVDIKQKRGPLNVAIDMRSIANSTRQMTMNMGELANDADKRARAGERQTQILFVFTFVTVIFTPISFTSSLFAVPSRDFPIDGEGNSTWAWWQIVTGCLVAEAATFAFIAAYMHRERRKGKNKAADRV